MESSQAPQPSPPPPPRWVRGSTGEPDRVRLTCHAEAEPPRAGNTRGERMPRWSKGMAVGEHILKTSRGEVFRKTLRGGASALLALQAIHTTLRRTRPSFGNGELPGPPALAPPPPGWVRGGTGEPDRVRLTCHAETGPHFGRLTREALHRNGGRVPLTRTERRHALWGGI